MRGWHLCCPGQERYHCRFVPAIIAREIFIRKSVINGRYWVNFLAVSFCLGFSAFYELIEWWIALSTGESAEAFLGTQGYAI